MTNNYIEQCLKTWYPFGHYLHSNPLHPALGLAGESGELINLYKKHLFKPGYSWFNCKYCNSSKELHEEHPGGTVKGQLFVCPEFVSRILDELGDLSYYTLILHYQANIELPVPYSSSIDPLDILAGINIASGRILVRVRNEQVIDTVYLPSVWRHIVILCEQLGTSIDEVMRLNGEKLLKGDNNGWQKAIQES